jgi:Ni/Fe-hydrogenase subunit HybB-like protein
MNTFQQRMGRWMFGGLAVGVIAGALCAAAAMFQPEQFYPAYLVAFLLFTGLSLGSLAISMLHHLTGGGWGIPIRRIVESAAAVLPLMAILFVPIVLGMKTLYPWTDAEHLDEVLLRKAAYLNEEAFTIRAAIYFGVWILFMLLLNRLSFTASAELQERRARALAIISGWGLTLWWLAVTFAAVDWSMSLEPHWYSSMYGVLFVAGQAVSALSLAIIVSVLLMKTPPAANVITGARLHDLGNFLLAFVMFWSYVSFMQFLIIWSGNLPEETPWYLRRSHHGWQVFVAILMGLHFLVPFLLLLMRQMKRNLRRMVLISAWLIGMRLVDLCWLVLPAFWEKLWLPWPLLVTLPAVGGLWLAAFAWRLSVRGPLLVTELEFEETTGEVVTHAH